MTPPPFVRGAQPSLLREWQAKMKSSVRQYLKAKTELAELEADIGDGDLTEEWEKVHDRERVLRGTVRGMAMMMLILSRPPDAAAKGKQYSENVHDLEVEYGMPGTKFRRQVDYNNQGKGEYAEDNRDLSPRRR